ncbi:hypothetical protein KAX02_07475 [candidate division WOR-3 bacterium]|nr:hypothetical protein [candidate division WOR-3 bacterium]
MVKTADAQSLADKTAASLRNRYLTDEAAIRMGSRAGRNFSTGFTQYEDLYTDVIKPAIPEDIGSGMHGMLRSVGYKVYKAIAKIQDPSLAATIGDGVTASFVASYGDLMEPAISAVVTAVLESQRVA